MDFDEEESVCTQTFRYNNEEDISTQPTLDAARGVNNVKVQVGQLRIKETTFPVYKGINIIGRDKLRCDIVLPSLTVSNRHAEIEADSKSDIFICDTGSSNGTLLNNTRLKKNKMYQILDQNVIQFGEISAKYVFLNMSKDTNSTEIQKPFVEQKSDTPNIRTSPIGTTKNNRTNADDEQQLNVTRLSKPSSSKCPPGSKEINIPIEDSFDDIFDVPTQKSVCVNDDPVKNRNKSNIIAEESIFDMETQRIACLVNDERRKQSDSVVEDSIFDVETQKSTLLSIVEESMFDVETQKPSEVCLDKPSVHSDSLVESSIFDAATQKFDNQSTKAEKGIDGIVHSTPLREDHKFTVPRKPPLKSLNISAIELSKTMLNQTNRRNSQVERNLDHSEDIFDAETQQLKQVNNQDMSIYDAPTQRLSSTAEPLNYNDSDTDEEVIFDSTSSKRSTSTKSLLKWDDKDLSIFDAPTQNIEKSQRFITNESIVNGSDNVTNTYHAEAQILKKEECGTTINDCNESSNESICLLDTESAREFLSKNFADISETDTCVMRKISLSENAKEPGGCDIYEAATQKLNNSAEDDDDSETDEELTFLDKVRANNYKELNIVDNDIFDAPTQEMTVTAKPQIDAIIFDAPTQKMSETSFDNDDIYDAPTQMILPAPAQVVNILDAPTQKMNAKLTTVTESSDSDTDQEGIFEPKNLAKKILTDINELANNKPTSQVENIFDAVTQKIVLQQGDNDDSETDEEGEFRVVSRKQTVIERNEHQQDDDIFDAPTQLMSCRKIDFEQHDSDSDIDMVPTQKLEGKQQEEQIHDDTTDKSMSEEDTELSDQQPPDDEQHLPATQKISNYSSILLDDSSNDVFQVKEKENQSVYMAPSPIEKHDSDSDIDMVATQKLEINHNKTNNSTILLDTSAVPIEEKLLKMVGESSDFKGSSPMLTQQLVDILEPSQQQPIELESSPIVRSRMRLKRTPKKCVTSQSVEDNLKGLLGEPQQTDDVRNIVSSQMLTQQIVDVLESQPSSSLAVAQENKTSGCKNASQVSETKHSRCAPIQINPEGYINLRPRRKRNFTDTSDEEKSIKSLASKRKCNGPPEAKQPTRPKRSAKTEQASAAGESSGTLRLSLTKKNDVWESIPTKSPDTNSRKDGLAKVASTRPRGRPRGSTKKKPGQVRK